MDLSPCLTDNITLKTIGPGFTSLPEAEAKVAARLKGYQNR
jgi:hypothetical protein